jgi:hypothetical protein
MPRRRAPLSQRAWDYLIEASVVITATVAAAILLRLMGAA